MNYDAFFERVTRDDPTSTGYTPLPYQSDLSTGELPTLLDIPTGLGKTAAVTVAWLYRRLTLPDATPRRLVYCLPMRSLVEQTFRETEKWIGNAGDLFGDDSSVPTANMLMGGTQQLSWAENPERPAVVIGTQDMLISRALMRGYGMSRYQWPIHYALLHNDALWIFDETQLMGVTVETSAQLEAFRRQFGTSDPSDSIWMSATLGTDQLDTVDHPQPDDGWNCHELTDDDYEHELVQRRISATKTVKKAETIVPRLESGNDKYARDLADEVVELHVDDTLTLVIINRVERAQNVYRALIDRHEDRNTENTGLLHSRFRRRDRDQHEQLLDGHGDRIIVSTQVVEAGMDISAQTMFTELAPWPSLVQRFGRCNRKGDQSEAQICWIDIEFKTSGRKSQSLLPYELDQIQTARELIASIDDAAPQTLDEVDYEPPNEVRPVLRKKDLLELFDTTSDLSGYDIDVSRYIRDNDDTDVQFYWRIWNKEDESAPPEELTEPHRDEICRVSIGQAGEFVDKNSVTAWEWDALDGQWRTVRQSTVRPGQTVLLDAHAGGYDPNLGWTGKIRRKKEPLTTYENLGGQQPTFESNDGDPDTDVDRWIPLNVHLEHVGDAVTALAETLGLDDESSILLRRAAQWHDIGKAHPAFQYILLQPTRDDASLEGPPDQGFWAKSTHNRYPDGARKHFRHELASTLAYLQLNDDDPRHDLTAYLIAAHHGKVRLSIRSLPDEEEPTSEQAENLYARGVWHNDELPSVEVPEHGPTGPVNLDLTPMELGEGSWLDRTLGLRDDLGPFNLSWLEALIRIGDHRASAEEKTRTG